MRIERIEVRELVGRFDYEIPMNLGDRITIITGPNGFGKTVLLRLLANLFSSGNAALFSIPFAQLKVKFDNGEVISVAKPYAAKGETAEIEKPSLHFAFLNGSKGSEFVLRERHAEQMTIPPGAIDELIPELERVETRMWRHAGTGEFLTYAEVVDRYSEILPFEAKEETPEWLKLVRGYIDVRFIQAERLQTSSSPVRGRHPRHRSSTNRAVKQYSEQLGALISQTLTDYATLSQSLDRTFPARVVSHKSPLSMEDLQKALKDIESKRARLAEAGLLGREGEEPTVPGIQQIDETKLDVLSVYVQDTHKKLSVFDELFAKVELFKKSINQRFLYKQLSVGKEGFSFTTEEGESLDSLSLSSGEQHEIVLLFELLFKGKENSLVLIDEPEISLHVAWQEQFLSDLRAVTALSHFDVLIATHSPQVISDRWDLTVELKGPRHEVLAQSSLHSK